MSDLQKLAAKAAKAGTTPSDPLVVELLDHARKFLPKLVKEMGRDLTAWAMVEVRRARDHYWTMIDQGTDPYAATELMRSELFPTPEDEAGKDEQGAAWQEEGAEADAEAEAVSFLTGPQTT
jgi:hypothetical protein